MEKIQINQIFIYVRKFFIAIYFISINDIIITAGAVVKIKLHAPILQITFELDIPAA
ncbi:conserved hypothetical protein [Ricinus communis]|uniref:Uncharacterized protein n=1 Tax=Ricinus communis TaxID=3988 RepID=B9S5M5_RICCO|nr:conserved hypothetical protein [Ricinus communis]